MSTSLIPISANVTTPANRTTVERLMVLSFYIIFVGFVIQVYDCYVSWKRFDILVTPIIPVPPEWNFSDYWLWFSFPKLFPEFYSSPPWMIVFMSGLWRALDAMMGRLPSVTVFAMSWISALTYTVYYTLNNHAKFSGNKLWWSFLVVMLSYPVAFNLERENVAGFVSAACILSVIFYREGKYNWSIVLLAFAANIKIIPLVFLIIPAIEHRWLLIAKYIIASLALYLFSFIIINSFMDYTYEFDKIVVGLQKYYSSFVIGDHGVPWETSMFETVKGVLMFTVPNDKYPASVVDALSAYHAVVFILSVVMVLLLYIKRPPFLHITVLLTCWFIAAPDVMANYYLAMLFLPLCLAVREGNKRYTILLSLGLISKWFYVPNMLAPHMFLSPVTILFIFIISIVDVLKMPTGANLPLNRISGTVTRSETSEQDRPVITSNSLIMIALYLAASAFMVEVYGGWIATHVFNLNFEPIVAFDKRSNFSDFWYWFQFPAVPATFFASPPGTIVLMKGFWSWISSIIGLFSALMVYMTTWALLLIYSFYYIIHHDKRFDAEKFWWCLIFVMVSYAVCFNMERQNIAGFVTALCMLAVVFYKEKKFFKSISCIAIVANIKIIPLVFLTLPFIEKRWGLLIKYIFAILTVFLLSFVIIQQFFDYNYSWNKIQWGLQHYYTNFALGDAGLYWGFSAFRGIKAIYSQVCGDDDCNLSLEDVAYYYHVTAGIFTGAMVLLLYIKRPPFLYTIIVLSLWFVLAPDAMENYYLDMLLLPLALALREGNKLYTILLMIAMIPKWSTSYLVSNSITDSAIIFLIFLLCMYQIARMPRPQNI